MQYEHEQLPELPEAHLMDSDAESNAAAAAASSGAGSRGWRRGAGAVVLALGLIAAGAVVSQKSLEARTGVLRATRPQAATVVLQAVTTPAPDKASKAPAAEAEGGEAAAKAKSKAAPSAKEASCKKPHADDEPGLFCWAVMWDSDEALIKSQLTGKAGMFACNDYAVISKEEKVLGKDDCGEVKTWAEKLPQVKKGMYGVNAETSSWLNVPVFMPCWDRVIKSGKVWEYDFTVKLDPDAVFFPERLRGVLAPHKGKPVFTTDCRFWGGDQVGKLFGAIEVLSKQTIGAYKTDFEKCKNLPWQGWGEDMWMQKCMDALGVPAVGLFDQVSDTTCPLGGGAPCSDQKKVVFHPKKDAGQWWECWKQSKPPAMAAK